MSVFIVGQSALASFLKLLMLLIAFILILAASYYVTKWYAKSGFIKKQTNNMEIIDTFSMGPNRQICIMTHLTSLIITRFIRPSRRRSRF